MADDMTVVVPDGDAKRTDDSIHDEVRVVVVDDVLDTVDMLAMMLEIDGYRVMTAGDAFHALQAVERHRPHCVLLDVHMPGTDGCDLSRELRDRYGDDILLIAVTGFDERDSRVAETFRRVDHWLAKPVDIDRLRRVLPPVLSRKKPEVLSITKLTVQRDQGSGVVPAAQWVERCAGQLLRLDEDISASEARDLALELYRFERTGAMSPEAAVEFVSLEFSSGNPRFERRSVPSV